MLFDRLFSIMKYSSRLVKGRQFIQKKIQIGVDINWYNM